MIGDVEKPGRKISSGQVALVGRLGESLRRGLLAQGVEVEAAAVVGDDHLDLRAAEHGRQR